MTQIMDLHFYILWILLLMFINCNTNTIDCLGPTSCEDQTLNCAANEPCTINCGSGHGQKACTSTNIYQNNATNMTINCLNYLACKNNHIHCGAGSCTLNCGNSTAGEESKDNQCQGSQLSCGTGPCNIHCYPGSCDDSTSINISSAISFQCTGDWDCPDLDSFSSTTQTPASIFPQKNPSISPFSNPSIFPPSKSHTTTSPRTIQPTVSPATETPTTYPISTPTNNSTTTTATNTQIIPSTKNAGHVITVTHVIDNIKDEKMNINYLWYIIGAVLFALICICCVIVLKKKYNSKSNVSIKNYNDVVHTMHRQSTSLQKNELNKYDGNNTTHIKALSNTIEGDIDLRNTYNVTEHHYKSSESKLNEKFDSNKHDFYNHISCAVKCDEVMLNDIHNHVETEGELHIISDEIVNNNIRGKTFNDNLVNVVVGNNMMMNDIINEMDTKKGDFDSQDDDEYFRSGYEMGMVNVHPYKANINK